MVIMSYLELPMLSYYVIYYEKCIKIMQRTEMESTDRNIIRIMRFDLQKTFDYVGHNSL